MECRRSLHHELRIDTTNARSMSIRSSSVMNHRSQTDSLAPKTVKFDLPLPKNLVLMQLMNIQSDFGFKLDEQLESNNQQDISSSVMASSSGTYIVIARDGLQVYNEPVMEEDKIIIAYDKVASLNSSQIVDCFRQLPFHPF